MEPLDLTQIAAPLPEPQTTRRIAHYRILRLLGEGGMGEVYHAFDEWIEREVAIKALRPGAARQPGTTERFRSEAIALARLSHPNIATLYSFLPDGPNNYMVIEYVKGEPLDRILRRVQRLPVEQAVAIAVPVLQALAHALDMGILHRDIKPANILINDAGEVKVTDFGIARFLGEARHTREGRLAGTFEYIAPERIRGQLGDVRSDLYAAGILLFEMLTGRLPFTGGSDFDLLRKHLEEPAPRLHEAGAAVPEPLADAVARALAKDPGERFQTPLEFCQALLPFLPEAPRRPTRTAPPESPNPLLTAASGPANPLRGRFARHGAFLSLGLLFAACSLYVAFSRAPQAPQPGDPFLARPLPIAQSNERKPKSLPVLETPLPAVPTAPDPQPDSEPEPDAAARKRQQALAALDQ